MGLLSSRPAKVTKRNPVLTPPLKTPRPTTHQKGSWDCFFLSFLLENSQTIGLVSLQVWVGPLGGPSAHPERHAVSTQEVKGYWLKHTLHKSDN